MCPAGIYPLTFAQDEDLGDAAGLVVMLATGFQLINIVRVDHGGEPANLDFGFGKLAESAERATAGSIGSGSNSSSFGHGRRVVGRPLRGLGIVCYVVPGVQPQALR